MSENKESNDPLDNLKPQHINWPKIEDNDIRNKAEKIIDEWLNTIHKDISELLEKHDLTVYQISFIHPGTKTPILLTRGDLLQTAILAATATRQLKTQIDERIQV
jgi:hypothetical protein